jgi:hypothetical protein
VDLLQLPGSGSLTSCRSQLEERSGGGVPPDLYRARSSPSLAVPPDQTRPGTSSCVKYPGGWGQRPEARFRIKPTAEEVLRCETLTCSDGAGDRAAVGGDEERL